MESPAEVTFEQAIARLEEIVRLLDGGEMPLNESLRLFEEGVGMAKNCSKHLTEAQGKLEALVKRPDGTTDTQDLRL